MPKDGVKLLKNEQKGNFNDFFLIFAPKTALKLILPAGLRIQFFFREVSYDVLSSEIMLMGQGQGGPGWYKRFSWKIAKKWLKLSKTMIFFCFFFRIIHKKWPIRYLLAKHIRGKYFEFFPLFIGSYVRKYCKKKSNFWWKLVFFYQNNHTALLNSAITCF